MCTSLNNSIFATYKECFMKYTVKEIAKHVQGSVEGDETLIISNLAKIEEGHEGTLTFLANKKYTPFIYTTKSSAVVVNKNFVAEHELSVTLIRVDDAYSSFAKLLEIFNTSLNTKKVISRKAKIHKTAKIGKNVAIGDFVSIGEHAVIGDNTVIHPNVTIYPSVVIKSNCLLYAGVCVLNNCVVGNNCVLHPGAIVGSDGFGFAPISDGKYMKIPQTGNVILEDDVEIGANATIDRATMGSTIIRKGTKIDNLIQIGHNCEIGSDTVIAGQTGVSGSTKIGNNCMIGGQVGIIGHLKIGNKVKIAAKSGVMVNIADEEFHMGNPSLNARNYKKSYVHFKQLDKLAKRVAELERQLEKQKQSE